MKPKLSILTPTIPKRAEKLSHLQEKIQRQIDFDSLSPGGFDCRVEHLMFCDNRMRSIGAKRQALVDIARGEYIAFIDDDDDVSEYYVEELLKAIESGADVITFHQLAIYNGLVSEIHFGIKNQDAAYNPGGVTLRAPWHVCAWKREVVAGCLFSESNYGEDLAWCLQARRRAKTGYHIPRVLHTYQHDAKTTAAPEPNTERACADYSAFDLWWEQNEWPSHAGIRRCDAQKIFEAGENADVHGPRP